MTFHKSINQIKLFRFSSHFRNRSFSILLLSGTANNSPSISKHKDMINGNLFQIQFYILKYPRWLYSYILISLFSLNDHITQQKKRLSFKVYDERVSSPISKTIRNGSKRHSTQSEIQLTRLSMTKSYLPFNFTYTIFILLIRNIF